MPQPTTSARPPSVTAADIQARLEALHEQSAQVQAALRRRQVELASPHLHLATPPAISSATASQGAQEIMGPQHQDLHEEKGETATAATAQGADEPLGPPHETLAGEAVSKAGGETQTALEEPQQQGETRTSLEKPHALPMEVEETPETAGGEATPEGSAEAPPPSPAGQGRVTSPPRVED